MKTFAYWLEDVVSTLPWQIQQHLKFVYDWTYKVKNKDKALERG